MSHLVSRILLAIFLIPAAAIVYILVFFVLAEGMNWRATSNIVAGVITWAFMAAYWTLLWRGSVQWNSWRITATLVSAVLLTIAGIFLGILAEQLVLRSEGMFGAFCGSMFVPVAW